MSDNIHTPYYYKKAARIQTLVCGFLFSIFSFVYLYVFQRDVLEALHYSLAHGRTHFAPLISTMVITLVLILLRWGVNSLLGLKGEVRSWAYFPSCLLLGVLTCVGRNVYMDEYHTSWGWILPIVLLVYVVLTYWLRRLFRLNLNAETAPITLLNSNMTILFALCLMTVLIGNTNRNFHHELQAEHFLRAQQYDKVLNVGIRSQKATRTLTALRAMAMSHQQTMGDKLFLYPQLYKSEGLFFGEDSLTTLRYTNDSLYYQLGVRPYEGEDHLLFLKNICYKGTGKHAALDYYLSALLLDKRIDEFKQALADFYDSDEELPRYYQEAAILYNDSTLTIDSAFLQRYGAFEEKRALLKKSPEEKKEMLKEFGDTYWWYYHYQK